MKRITLAVLLLVAGCKKSSDNLNLNSVSIYDGTRSYATAIGVTLNGVSSIDNSPYPITVISIQTVATPSFPIAMAIEAFKKDSATLTYIQTPASSFIPNFTENGVSYQLDSGMITLSAFSDTMMSGNFQLWLNGGKTVQGYFNCPQPKIIPL